MLFANSLIRSNEHSDIDASGSDGRIIIASGRQCAMHGVAPDVTILVPLFGTLSVVTEHSTLSATRGGIVLIEPGQRIQAVGNGLFIAVLLSRSTWRSLIDARQPVATPILFPCVHRADRSTLGSIIELARVARHADALTTQLAAVSFVRAMTALQASFEPLIARCPGRAWAQRRNVLLRLMRARNFIESDCHRNLDVGHLAAMANYSTFHFIRAFRAVFGRTPYSQLVEQRLERAHGLLNTSPLAVYEIAHIAGFEDRSAFARSFKRRYGISATDLRQQHQRRSLQAVA
jgi:AraC family transcriptional regulator